MMRRVLDPDPGRRVRDDRLVYGRVAAALDLQGGHARRLDGPAAVAQQRPAQDPDAMFGSPLDVAAFYVDHGRAADMDSGERRPVDRAAGQLDRRVIADEHPVGAGSRDGAAGRRQPGGLLRHQAGARGLVHLASKEVEPAVTAAENSNPGWALYLATARDDMPAPGRDQSVAASADDGAVGEVD